MRWEIGLFLALYAVGVAVFLIIKYRKKMGDKMKQIFKAKKKRFSIIKSIGEIQQNTSQLPAKDECFKYISNGGFSSISFILFVTSKEKILELYVSTFRVGRKEAQNLHALKKSGKLENAFFLASSLFSSTNKNQGKKYNYYDDFCGICNSNGWKFSIENNHSKIILMKTEKNWYVIETSSNLNENPKIEQFSFENSEELFDFYKTALFHKVVENG